MRPNGFCLVEIIDEGVGASFRRLEVFGANLSAIGLDRLLLVGHAAQCLLACSERSVFILG